MQCRLNYQNVRHRYLKLVLKLSASPVIHEYKKNGG